MSTSNPYSRKTFVSDGQSKSKIKSKEKNQSDLKPSFKIAFVVFFEEKKKKNSFKTEWKKKLGVFTYNNETLKKDDKESFCVDYVKLIHLEIEIDKLIHHEDSSEKDLGPLAYLRWSSLW